LALLLFRSTAPLRSLDSAVVLLVIYEALLLLLSRIRANGTLVPTVLTAARLLYLLVWLVAHGSGQAVSIAALIGSGGVALACFAMSQFGRQLDLLRTREPGTDETFSDLHGFAMAGATR
jgi:hypothetical protein